MTSASSPNDPHGSAKAKGEARVVAQGSLLPSVVRNLASLVQQQSRFSTVYADPPWPYSNTAARGAAENHYRTLTMETIRNEPVRALVADQAHLHLWKTNAFLRESFDVIRDWGFRYKSCLIWVKPQLGMGKLLARLARVSAAWSPGKSAVSGSHVPQLETCPPYCPQPQTFPLPRPD